MNEEKLLKNDEKTIVLNLKLGINKQVNLQSVRRIMLSNLEQKYIKNDKKFNFLICFTLHDNLDFKKCNLKC